MKGSNTLKINQATMMEAVQLWIDKTMHEPPKVTAVKSVAGAYNQDAEFEVVLSEQEPAT